MGIAPFKQGSVDQALITSTAAGATLTAAAAASCIPAASIVELPPNYWYVGKSINLRASGTISCVVTTPGTARFDLRIGAVVVWDSLAIPLNIVAKVSVPWVLDIVLTCRAIGATASLIGIGFWLSEAALNVAVPATGPGPGGNLLPYNTAPAVGTTWDSRVAANLDFFFTQTVATGSLICQQYAVSELD